MLAVCLCLTAVAEEKPVIKLYGKCVEYTSGPMMTDAVIEMLKDKYTVEAIQIDWTNQDKVIRTGIASGEPCDIYNYVPTNMMNFEGMAVDLKPYLDADPEWAAQFSANALAAGTYDGQILNVPWELNFTVVLANKEILDELGIEVPETWTMDAFMEVCQVIRDAGYYPFANATDLNRANWLYRNALLSITVSEGSYEALTAGELPLDGDESRRALEAVKALYDADYMYPGEGAVTAKNDEIKAGFYQGKVVMMPEIAAGAKVTASEADFEVVVVPWPSVGEKGAINGGFNGFFIPVNASNIEGAVEVLKAMTSAEVQKIHADEGYLPANVNVEVSDPFVQQVLAQAGTLYTPEEPNTVELNDYKSNQLMPELILGGGVDAVLSALGALDSVN